MLTQVAEGVLVHQSELLQNNTAVVQGKAGVLLVDAGITGDEMACLANDLRELGQPVVAGFSTHPDWDHVLWHAELGEAPRYGTPAAQPTCETCGRTRTGRPASPRGCRQEIAEDVPLDPFGLITGLPAGTAQIPWDGPPVRIIEHPAHSPGHAALLIEDRGVLVAGDMLSDVFIPMLDDWNDTNDPIEEYLVGLRLLEGVADDVDVVIPGHGSVGRADQVRARIELDRAYVHALRDGQAPDDPRIGPSAKPGWEWVSDIHEGQAQSLATEKRTRRDARLAVRLRHEPTRPAASRFRRGISATRDSMQPCVALRDRRHGASSGRGAFGAWAEEPPGRLGPHVRTPRSQRCALRPGRFSRVELRGLEPLTLCMPCRCATSCATAPGVARGWKPRGQLAES